MKKTLLFINLLLAVGFYSLTSAHAEYYSDGYTIIYDTPIKNADLKQIINKPIPAQNMHQGLTQVLNGTGWQLAPSYSMNPQIERLFNAPWPSHWRFVGPDQLDNILKNIGGAGWQLVVDPVNRLVGFEIKPEFQKKRGQ